MTRPRIAKRRRAAGGKPERRWIPTQAKCLGCGKTRYVDRETGLCGKCVQEQEAAIP